MAILEDLGIQQAPHSTLNSYLEKLLYLLTGNFAKSGTMNFHSRMASLGGGPSRHRESPVGGHRIITGLIPGNVIPDEILTDHPRRFRAMLVESTNPVHSLADGRRMREALDALELVVVIDVAMSETARHAHYVLPAPSQFEKWEATFFTLEFPENVFHLRRPMLEPLPGPLPEPEIHRRLVRALGALSDEDLAPLHEAAARGRADYAKAFLAAMAERPHLGPLAPIVLYETLGPTCPTRRGGRAPVGRPTPAPRRIRTRSGGLASRAISSSRVKRCSRRSCRALRPGLHRRRVRRDAAHGHHRRAREHGHPRAAPGAERPP